MLTQKDSKVIILTAFSLLTITSTVMSDELPERKNQSLSRPTQTKEAAVLNINNLVSWYRANGQGQYGPPSIQGDGSTFPRGTTHPFFADGLVWGAKVYLDAAFTQPAPPVHPVYGPIRVGGGTYNVGNQIGWVIGTGANARGVDPADPRARIYRIRRDYSTMSDDELARDALENFYWGGTLNQVTISDMAVIRAQYATDWNEWPVDLGAPYIERNGTPGYQPPPAFQPNPDEANYFPVDSLILGNYDEPGLAGTDPNSPADQVMWAVSNDLDPGPMAAFEGASPMGLEVQMTIWGYKRTDALGNLFFKRIRLINKGGGLVDTLRSQLYLDSMFVAQWADPDLGDAGDDLVGCDTALSVGFIYNGNPIDREYAKFGLPPAAAGYDFLAGPIVFTGNPSDSAVFDLRRRYGYINLPMTSFSWFAAGSTITDPPFNYEGGLRWWKMLRGFVPDPSTQADRLYPVGPGETPDKFPLSGDPVARRGKLDGLGTAYSFAPGDRRLVMSSGPLQLAAGDTQDIVMGQVAGLGADRLSSISVMKFNDRFVQLTFDALFQVPKPPVAPKVTVTEVNQEVNLEWGSDFNAINVTEVPINQPGSYAFEGYNVYQLPSQSASLASARRIATFDLINDFAVVLDEQFDPNSGQILNLPVQFGSNSGVRRYFTFNRDFIRDIDKLWNGQEYYLSVTAYSVALDSGYIPKTLESPLQVMTVRPKHPFGTTYGTKAGDIIEVVHTSTSGVLSDGVVTPLVVNPAASTGDTYQVGFDTLGNWFLRNVTKNQIVIADQTNQSGDVNYPIVQGGIFLTVTGPPVPGLKTDAWQWVGSRFLTFAGGANGLEFEEFAGAVGWASPRTVFGDGQYVVQASELRKIEIRFAAVNTTADTLVGGEFDVNDPNASYAYRYLRLAGNPPARPSFAPWIVNPTAGGYRYQDYRISAPLAVYDMDVTPPRRLAVGYLENNVARGAVDGYYWPPFFNGDGSVVNPDNTASTGPREWLFIFDETYSDATPNPTNQAEIIAGIDMRVMYFATWARRNANPWPAGNVFILTPNRLNTAADVFTYALPAPGKSIALEKASVEKINVFPNPYYAFNPAETNRFVRFVTFNNLPRKAKVRIFNLAGQLVRTLDKDDASQFTRWDLNNQSNFPVASGIYIAHLELTLSSGELVTKILKLAIIQEQEVPDTYGERVFQ
jgi:hypothetical protein